MKAMDYKEAFMKLMTKELEEAFARQGNTEEKSSEETMVIAHYFNSSWDWWATEFDPQARIFFGLVRGFEVEFGSFSLDELESNSCNVKPLGGIERDLYWHPVSLAAVLRKLKKSGV